MVGHLRERWEATVQSALILRLQVCPEGSGAVRPRSFAPTLAQGVPVELRPEACGLKSVTIVGQRCTVHRWRPMSVDALNISRLA